MRAASAPLEILTVAEMTRADRQAVEGGASEEELMERAGGAVATAVSERFSPRPTVVLAGPGNNGGDGYVVARLLAERGFDVRLAAEGAGYHRWHLAPEVARLARALEKGGAEVVAVDVPSGVSGDAGRPLGDVSFRAALTVTFHRLKPAHVLEPGRGLCGEVVVGDIGLGESRSNLFANAPELWSARFPWPSLTAHKHSRGRLIVVSGEAIAVKHYSCLL